MKMNNLEKRVDIIDEKALKYAVFCQLYRDDSY